MNTIYKYLNPIQQVLSILKQKQQIQLMTIFKLGEQHLQKQGIKFFLQKKLMVDKQFRKDL